MSLDALIARLKKHEGLSLKPYRDSLGVLTIGYGLNLEEGITEKEAEWLLQSRIGQAVRDAARACPSFRDLSEIRQEVLVDMAYNLGLTRLQGFAKMLRAIDKRDFDWAADEMMDSQWARQVGNRATSLAFAMRHNTWP